MSYILDALKRADAERERGRVPGLHTRTTPELDTPAAETSGMAQRGWLIVLGVLLALGAVLWWWMQAASLGVQTIPAASAVPKPVAPAPVATVSPAPPLAPSASIQTSASAGGSRNVTSETAPPVLPILSPPPPPVSAKATASPPTVPDAVTQRKPIEPATAAAKQKNTSATTSGGATAAAAAAVAVQSFAELSTDARARLPAVNISGSTYSKNPALRMLIANGKVVQEGGEIAPGLTLETIEQRSAVLNHQGLRYRIGY
jgi:general secretion pathway protein B